MAKKAKKAKTTSRKAASKTAAAGARKRVSFEDTAKITVVGEHNRREDSRYGKGYAVLKTAKTVGAFRAKRKDDAQELLRAAIKDNYIKVA